MMAMAMAMAMGSFAQFHVLVFLPVSLPGDALQVERPELHCFGSIEQLLESLRPPLPCPVVALEMCQHLFALIAWRRLLDHWADRALRVISVGE